MLADPLLTEHYAKAGLRAVLIDQQHGLSFSSYWYSLFVILKLLGQTNHRLASSMDLAFKQLQLILSWYFHDWQWLARSVGRAHSIWMCSTAWEIPNMLPDCQGCRQHTGAYQVNQDDFKEQKKHPKSNLLFLSSRALDAGACGIVAPMISTRDDAQRLVEQCRCSKLC